MALTRIAGACLPFLASVFGAHHDNSITVQLDPPAPYRAPSLSVRHRQAETALRAIMFGECRGRGVACMEAIGHAALNRAAANLPARYGVGLAGVIGKRKAFSCLNARDPNWRIIKAALEGRLAAHSPNGIAWTMAAGEAHMLMHRWHVDPTHGATHYYAVTIKPPAWTNDHGMVRTAAIAGHVFYRKAA